ncbi:hypothetical protein D3C80_2037540 [compost metagenome]
MQGAQGRTGDGQTGAEGAPLRIDVDHVHFNANATQGDRCGHPRGTGADDQCFLCCLAGGAGHNAYSYFVVIGTVG